MNKDQIKKFLEELSKTKDRNIVIIDFGNVDKWEKSLEWSIGIKKLGKLIKHFAQGKQFLRRFYYGEDYGPKDKNTQLLAWSETILNSARYNGFEIISKRVKYIPDEKYSTGYIKKCNLDIEMALDLIKEVSEYDKVILFSGDGDLACVIDYLNTVYSKEFYIFAVRDHLGKELVDLAKEGKIKKILFVEDFEYRLNLRR